MELSAFCEAASRSVTQGWNPKFHHRVHKSLPLAPTLSEINLVHITTP
jgi:hypothetical protein